MVRPLRFPAPMAYRRTRPKRTTLRLTTTAEVTNEHDERGRVLRPHPVGQRLHDPHHERRLVGRLYRHAVLERSARRPTYYGSTGATFDTGPQSAAGSSTTTAPNTSGADTGGTPLTRGAVTTQTAPTKKVAPTAAARPAARKAKRPRRVRLAVARVDPWSVMKMSFLLSVALGIAGVILTAVLWMILSTMNVFTDIEGVLQSLQTTTSDPFSIKDYVGFGRVVSLSIVIGVIDVILMTAIATVMAFLYNICSALVGGVQLTLTDD